MESIFTKEMQADLLEVDNSFKKSLSPWWEEISGYVPEAQQDISFRLLPAMVIDAYRFLGLERDLALQMANMFKTIYLASKIHVLIGDDEEGQQHNQELQFSILIGDYIFGRVLKLLLETHTDQLLHMFAAMICQINEGLIVKYKSAADLDEVLAQTRAPFYHYAFLSAAKMAGMGPGDAELYGKIGHNIGMALELLIIDLGAAGGFAYVEKAQQLAAAMDHVDMPGRAELHELIQGLKDNIGGGADGL
jgi:geranylgeranyl pyrophosphate synthase